MPAEAWVALAMGLLAILGTLITAVWYLATLVGKSLTRFELIGGHHALEINRMNVTVEKIEVTIAEIAVDRERATSVERRVARLEQWYDDLRRGRGLIHEAE